MRSGGRSYQGAAAWFVGVTTHRAAKEALCVIMTVVTVYR